MSTFITVFLVIGFLFSVFSSGKTKKSKEELEQEAKVKKQGDYDRCKKIISKHIDALAVQRRQLVNTDPYGTEILTNWETKGIKYFIDHYVNLPGRNSIADILTGHCLTYSEISEMIEEMVKAHQLKLLVDDTYSDDLTGHQFEMFCEDKLKKEGWEVSRTKGSGDQGVDLIIKNTNRMVAVQCKKSKTAISNKAVQEVVAGMKYYGADQGLVITNSKYTKSAILLADANNIKLIHYLETKSI